MVAIGLVLYFGVQQSVLGVSETLDFGEEGSNVFDFDDGIAGTGTAVGSLTLPNDTSLFAFTVNYQLKTIYKSTTTGRANVKYEIFNPTTNAWETIHDKSWSISGCSTSTNTIDFDGETVYQNGLPEHIVSSLVGSGTYDKYFGCLNGMTVEEAKQLNVWLEGTSTYRYYCMYPDTYQKEYDYRDASDNYDLEYFPPLITKDKSYINSDNKVLFRITYNSISGLRSKDNGDFRIQLWNVETPKTTVFFPDENKTECISQEKYNYQILATDYYTKGECEYQNNITECYLDTHCSCTDEATPIAKCSSGTCTCEKEPNIIDQIFGGDDDEEPPITGDVISGDEKETNYPLIFLISMIVIVVLAIIIIFMKRRK